MGCFFGAVEDFGTFYKDAFGFEIGDCYGKLDGGTLERGIVRYLCLAVLCRFLGLLLF